MPTPRKEEPLNLERYIYDLMLQEVKVRIYEDTYGFGKVAKIRLGPISTVGFGPEGGSHIEVAVSIFISGEKPEFEVPRRVVIREIPKTL